MAGLGWSKLRNITALFCFGALFILQFTSNTLDWRVDDEVYTFERLFEQPRSNLEITPNGPVEHVVWMFPFSPKENNHHIGNHEILVCPFENACADYNSHHRRAIFNLKEITKDSFFENYVRDHAFNKIRHWKDFPTHIQVITLLSLLQKHAEH